MEHDSYSLRQFIFDFSYTLDPEERRLLERSLRLLFRAGIEEIIERTTEGGPFLVSLNQAALKL